MRRTRPPHPRHDVKIVVGPVSSAEINKEKKFQRCWFISSMYKIEQPLGLSKQILFPCCGSPEQRSWVSVGHPTFGPSRAAPRCCASQRATSGRAHGSAFSLWKLTHQLHAQGLNSVIPQPAIHICRSGNGTDDGRIHNVASPRSWFDPAVKKSGVQDFNWHALRHTFISRLVMNGVDLRTVQELAGHKSIAMTMRSAHLAPSHLDAAIEKTMSPTATTTATEQESRSGSPPAVVE